MNAASQLTRHALSTLMVTMLLVAASSTACVSAAPQSKQGSEEPMESGNPVIVKSQEDISKLRDAKAVYATALSCENVLSLLEVPGLKSITFDGVDLSDSAIWKRISSSKSLTQLNIDYVQTGMIPKDWPACIDHLADSGLEHLRLGIGTSGSGELLQRLSKLERIKHLHVQFCASKLHDPMKSFPPEAVRWEHLEVLSLGSDGSAETVTPAWMASFGQLRNLKTLSLQGVKLDSLGCKGLAKSTSLRNLKLWGCSFLDNVVPDELVFSHDLESVELRLYFVTDQEVGKFLRRHKPARICIDCTASVKLTGSFLSGFSDWRFLRELELTTNDEDERSNWSNATLIRVSRDFPLLERLCLNGERIATDEVVVALLAAKPRELRISNCGLLNTKTIDQVVLTLEVQKLSLLKLTGITVEAALAIETKFYSLRSNQKDTSIVLEIDRAD